MNSTQANQLYSNSLDYLQGQGVAMDERRAFELNQWAAEAGMHDAVLAMGWFYLNGIGIEKDITAATRWYKKSARCGEPKAMFSLGQIAYDSKDWATAHRWFKRASQKGHFRSVFWLGKLHWKGRGVDEDKKLAQELFHHAASKKVAEAQRTLAIFQCLAKRHG